MKYLFLIPLLVLAMGCEDMLTPVPENSITFNNIETEKDLESIMNGVGYDVKQMTFYIHPLLTRGSYRSDPNLNTSFSLEYNLDPAYTPSFLGWDDYYKTINQANIILKFIDQVDLSEDRRHNYLGQAYFYKAFAYYFLIRFFGDCVLLHDDPIISASGVAKSPWTQVADYAIDLAAKAAEMLPDFEDLKDSDGNPVTYKSIPCKGAANALLAYLCAWKAGGKYFANEDYDEMALWRQAEEACSWVIDSTDTYRMAANPEEVVTSVLRGNSSESVYETVWTGFPNEYSLGYTCGVASLYTGWPVMPNTTSARFWTEDYVITNEDVRRMYPDGDLRRDAYFYNFEEMEAEDPDITKGFAYCYKYRYVAVYTMAEDPYLAGIYKGMDCNQVWWRLADVILLRAECRARLGDNAGAIADLNRVRARANAALYDASEYDGDLRFTIFKEREKELLAEGQRWFDIVRNEYVARLMGTGWQQLTDQDFKEGVLFLPIVVDYTLNPSLRQNEYWLKHAK